MANKIAQVFYRICFMILIPVVTLIHYSLNVYRPNVHNISTVLDNLIPFNQLFALPYVYWFAYLPAILVYFAIVNSKVYFKLLGSVIIGMCCCFVVFYFFPTTVPRPDVVGADFFSNLVRYIYGSDNPYNCFPSIHVLDAFLPTIFLCKYNKNLLIRIVAILSFVSITASTVFIKQHYVLDAVASVALGTGMFLIFDSEYLWNKLPVKRVLDALIPSRTKETA